MKVLRILKFVSQGTSLQSYIRTMERNGVLLFNLPLPSPPPFHYISQVTRTLACEHRRISGCRFAVAKTNKRQPEIRLDSPATITCNAHLLTTGSGA